MNLEHRIEEYIKNNAKNFARDIVLVVNEAVVEEIRSEHYMEDSKQVTAEQEEKRKDALSYFIKYVLR